MSNPPSPLLAQYREIKSRHTDAILFFRMGDFYEMFYEDAETAVARAEHHAHVARRRRAARRRPGQGGGRLPAPVCRAGLSRRDLRTDRRSARRQGHRQARRGRNRDTRRLSRRRLDSRQRATTGWWPCCRRVPLSGLPPSTCPPVNSSSRPSPAMILPRHSVAWHPRKWSFRPMPPCCSTMASCAPRASAGNSMSPSPPKN